jgi:hypothetical protein
MMTVRPSWSPPTLGDELYGNSRGFRGARQLSLAVWFFNDADRLTNKPSV